MGRLAEAVSAGRIGFSDDSWVVSLIFAVLAVGAIWFGMSLLKRR